MKISHDPHRHIPKDADATTSSRRGVHRARSPLAQHGLRQLRVRRGTTTRGRVRSADRLVRVAVEDGSSLDRGAVEWETSEES